MPESKYWIKPASWRLTDLACRPARSDSSRLRCSLAISRLPSRSSTKSYCGEEQTGAWQVTGWPAAPPASPPTSWQHTCILTKHQLQWVCSHDCHLNYRRELTFKYGLIIISITNDLLCFSFNFWWRIKLLSSPSGQFGVLEEGEQELYFLSDVQKRRWKA